MKKIPWGQFTQLKGDDAKKAMPLLITFNAEDWGIFVDPEDVIVVADLHPRVRNMLRMQEKRARIGMPPPIKVWADVIRKGEADVLDPV